MNNPMSAFAGVDFDCVFYDHDSRDNISQLVGISPGGYFIPEEGMERDFCRPRLNKAQVLKDYTPILVDGFVWKINTVHCRNDGVCRPYYDCVTSKQVKKMGKATYITNITFIGVEANKGLDAWAKSNDVPVVTL